VAFSLSASFTGPKRDFRYLDVTGTLQR
jgi:hypothetical protein